MYTTLRALIIDPSADRRARLKQAALAYADFSRVYSVPSLKEARAHLCSQPEYDLVFVSFAVGEDEALKFVIEGKKEESPRDAAFVLVLPPRSQNAETFADSLLEGADGFLLEPFSAEGLREMSDLAREVKREKELARERAALSIMIKNVRAISRKLLLAFACGAETDSFRT